MECLRTCAAGPRGFRLGIRVCLQLPPCGRFLRLFRRCAGPCYFLLLPAYPERRSFWSPESRIGIGCTFTSFCPGLPEIPSFARPTLEITAKAHRKNLPQRKSTNGCFLSSKLRLGQLRRHLYPTHHHAKRGQKLVEKTLGDGFEEVARYFYLLCVVLETGRIVRGEIFCLLAFDDLEQQSPEALSKLSMPLDPQKQRGRTFAVLSNKPVIKRIHLRKELERQVSDGGTLADKAGLDGEKAGLCIPGIQLLEMP